MVCSRSHAAYLPRSQLLRPSPLTLDSLVVPVVEGLEVFLLPDVSVSVNGVLSQNRPCSYLYSCSRPTIPLTGFYKLREYDNGHNRKE